MEKEARGVVEKTRQLTKKEEEIISCQYTILTYAVKRLHYYAYFALDAFKFLSFPKEMMIRGLKANASEPEKISFLSFLKQEELKNEFLSENLNFEEYMERMNFSQIEAQKKMQKNLRQKVAICFARLSTVGLIHEVEEIMKYFLMSDDMYQHGGIDNFNVYFYDTEKIKQIQKTINKNKQKKGISFIGFNDLLKSVDEKYDITNKKHSFYNNIKECQSFANLVKHKSQKAYDDLLKYPNLFLRLETTDEHKEPSLDLNTFYSYVSSFESFWVHICKNVHKPMERNEFIIESHRQIDLYIKQYQEHPWNKERKIMDKIEKG